MYTDTLHPEISHGARMDATFPDQPSPCGYCKRSVLGNFGLGTRLVRLQLLWQSPRPDFLGNYVSATIFPSDRFSCRLETETMFLRWRRHRIVLCVVALGCVTILLGSNRYGFTLTDNRWTNTETNRLLVQQHSLQWQRKTIEVQEKEEHDVESVRILSLIHSQILTNEHKDIATTERPSQSPVPNTSSNLSTTMISRALATEAIPLDPTGSTLSQSEHREKLQKMLKTLFPLQLQKHRKKLPPKATTRFQPEASTTDDSRPTQILTPTLQSILALTVNLKTSQNDTTDTQTQLPDVFISVKATQSFHSTRLSLLLVTWMQNVRPQQVRMHEHASLLSEFSLCTLVHACLYIRCKLSNNTLLTVRNS